MDEVFDGAKVGRADGGAVLAAPADKQPEASMVPPSSGIARCAAGKFRVNFLESEPWLEQERGYEG
jgi:hypothetical protein